MLACQSTLAQTRIVPAAGEQQEHNAVPITFDIPPQPLDVALKQFSAVAGIELFYETSVVQGRRSSAVSGRLPAAVALRLLLRETGLTSTSFDRGTITILPPTEGDLAGLDRAKAKVVEFAPYLARMQRSMDRALCGEPSVGDDPEDLLVRLWIAPSGKVSRAELIWTTGSNQRDRTYIAAIGTVAIGAPPPAAMPQPVNMMINARASRASPNCDRSHTELRYLPHD
jgi:hypothetical protein